MKRAERTYGTHSSEQHEHYEPQNRRERSREAIWRNNSQKFPSPRRQIENQVGTVTEIGLKRPILRYIINISSKATNKENLESNKRENNLLCTRQCLLDYQQKFSTEILQSRRKWNDKNQWKTLWIKYTIFSKTILLKKKKDFPKQKMKKFIITGSGLYMKCLKKSYKLKQRDNKQQQKTM